MPCRMAPFTRILSRRNLLPSNSYPDLACRSHPTTTTHVARHLLSQAPPRFLATSAPAPPRVCLQQPVELCAVFRLGRGTTNKTKHCFFLTVRRCHAKRVKWEQLKISIPDETKRKKGTFFKVGLNGTHFPFPEKRFSSCSYRC